MKDYIYHNSQELSYRSPFGAVSCEQEITIKLTVSAETLSCYLHYWQESNLIEQDLLMENIENNEGLQTWQIKLSSPTKPDLLWYYFSVHFNGKVLYYGNNSEGYGGAGEVSHHIPLPYQITVFQHQYLPPKWFMETIIYQIFVDRFYNGHPNQTIVNPKKNSLLHSHWENQPIYIKDSQGKIVYWDFFGGNLLGVQKKLSYFQELGVGAIYFNPIFEAPSNHKYDTGDYHRIDPMYGDKQLFSELLVSAKKLGIEVILDGVFSHTGSDSVYFNKEGSYDSLGAYQSKDSPYFEWYRFNSFPDDYQCWWGIEVLPNVNELNTSYQDFIIYNGNSVLNHWQQLGVKGWRLDVADELPDSFIRGFNLTMKKQDYDAVLIGEVWEDASNKISYGERRRYLIEDELDSVTNYPFRQAVLDFLLGYRNAYIIDKLLMSIYENYPLPHFYSLMNLLGTHDTPRILSVLQNNLPNFSGSDQKRIAIQRLKLAVLWQMTYPGVPLIYYGDEAGLEGVEEPLNRRPYPWGKENDELLEWYKVLTSLRNSYEVFTTGEWISTVFNEDVYGYIRRIRNGMDVFQQVKKDNTVVILMNRSLDREYEISINIEDYSLGEMYDVLNNNSLYNRENDCLHVRLLPLEGKVLLANPTID